jgi:hypothetical protein
MVSLFDEFYLSLRTILNYYQEFQNRRGSAEDASSKGQIYIEFESIPPNMLYDNSSTIIIDQRF